MPSVITHYLLGKRVLSRVRIADPEAFLIGAQGPDIFFFFRAYPWLFGKAGLPVGNALHEVRPSLLIDKMRCLANKNKDDESIIESYICGFLCHYAADRTIHPLVHNRQQALKTILPHLGDTDDPYHYYCESALDAIMLRHDENTAVSVFRLTSVLPPENKRRSEALATFYEKLLKDVVGECRRHAELTRLTRDMRQSMWWMTDRFGIKRKLIRAAEAVLRRDARFSSLVRTEKLPPFDFANTEHGLYETEEYGDCRDDMMQLCDKTVALAVSLIEAYRNGATGWQLTNDIDFTGHRMNIVEDKK